jgi:hypothetical protein
MTVKLNQEIYDTIFRKWSERLDLEMYKSMIGACSTVSNCNKNDPVFTIDNLEQSISELSNILKPSPEITICECDFLTEVIQTKYPKKKKNKRWMKKYRKKYTSSQPSLEYYWMKETGNVFCHPIMANKFKVELNRRNSGKP